jgi:hypothetical protein
MRVRLNEEVSCQWLLLLGISVCVCKVVAFTVFRFALCVCGDAHWWFGKVSPSFVTDRWPLRAALCASGWRDERLYSVAMQFAFLDWMRCYRVQSLRTHGISMIYMQAKKIQWKWIDLFHPPRARRKLFIGCEVYYFSRFLTFASGNSSWHSSFPFDHDDAHPPPVRRFVMLCWHHQTAKQWGGTRLEKWNGVAATSCYRLTWISKWIPIWRWFFDTNLRRVG